MTKIQILLGIVLAVFGFETAWAIEQFGYVGFFENLLSAGFPTLLVAFDLVIALGLVAAWMWNDARERGATLWPFLVLTVTLGSVGPLLYLIRRESALKQPTAAERSRAAQPA
jgi:hypothetical protein